MLEETHRKILLALLRMSMGWVFFWAFIDKLFGLGFSTCKDAGLMCEKAWLAGGSPVTGFLSHAAGPFPSVFQWLGTTPVVVTIVNWLFMLGLLGVGLALILGAGMKIAAYAGSVMLVLMWLASPPTTNPFLDDHLVYAVVLFLLRWLQAGHYFGLGDWWEKHEFVARHPWLD